uniref:hypothetical protein n=1 Tax=Ruminococcus bromii TaxID=40518 RepID=UPI003FF0E2AC
RHLAKVEVAGSSPVIRSIKISTVDVLVFLFYRFFCQTRGSKATVKKMLQWSIFRESVDES